MQFFFERIAAATQANPFIAVLVDSSLKGVAVLLGAAVVALALRRASAAARHMAWTLAFTSLLALPILASLLPAWRVPLLPEGVSTPSAREIAIDASEPVAQAISRSLAQPTAPRAQPTLTTPTRLQPSAEPSEATIRVPASTAVLISPAGRVQTSAASNRVASGWPLGRLSPSTWVLMIWGGVAALILATLFLGMGRVWMIAHFAQPLEDDEWGSLVRRVRAELGLRRQVTLLKSDGPSMPMTWGFVHPVVLLPADAHKWPAPQRRAVLVHELAHVQRYDCLTQLLAQIACAFHWFNPFVWNAAHAMRIERERACDDQVLNAGSKASEYAGHLLEVARSLRTAGTTSLATVAMARRSQLAGRLLAVLQKDRSRRTVTRALAIPAWLTAAMLVAPLAAFTPVRQLSQAQPVGGAHPEAGTGIDASAARVTPSLLPATRDLLGHDNPETNNPGAIALDDPRDGAVLVIGPRMQCLGQEHIHTHHTDVNDKNEWHVKWVVGRCSGEAEVRGDIEFNDAFTDIIGISDGGRFKLEVDDGDVERRIDIRVRRDGTLERRWYVDGRQQEYDDAARAALAEMLREFFHNTTYQAEKRSVAILEREGVDGVLNEIALIQSSSVKRAYFATLLKSGDLDSATLQRLLRQASEEVTSDFELAQLLIYVAERFLTDDDLRLAYVEAANTISSDHEHRRVLAAALEQGGLKPDVLDAMLVSAQEISSDFELAQLLIDIAKAYPADQALPQSYLDAANTISSDHEHRRVLSALTEHGVTHPARLDQILQSAQEISSDFELAQMLIQVGRAFPSGQAFPPSYLEAASTISSDHELRRVFSMLLERGHPTPETLDGVLATAAREINSDFELAQLLVAIAKAYPTDETLPPTFLQAVNTIGSDHEHRRVLSALLERGNLDVETLNGMLQSAGEIDSDFELARFLIALANIYPADRPLPATYLEAASSISSDYEHRRVLSKLVEREQLDARTLTAILEAAQQISSDYELAQLLIKIAKTHPIEGDVREAFLEAADTIGSTHDQSRVLAELVRNERGR